MTATGMSTRSLCTNRNARCKVYQKLSYGVDEHGFDRERPVKDIKSHPESEIRALAKLVNSEDVRRCAKKKGFSEEVAVKHCLEREERVSQQIVTKSGRANASLI